MISMLRVLDEFVEAGGRATGVPPATFKVFFSILAAYPLSLNYRLLSTSVLSNPVHRHLYFAVTGLTICIFNFGLLTYHSIVSVLVTYFITRSSIAATPLSVVIGFFFHMTYLTLGYAAVANDETYDIRWTTAQCVLCLRHIGLLFDLWDGKASSSGSSPAPLTTRPSLLELIAHTYFFGGFLVGPQFPMARYRTFIEHDPNKSFLENSVNQTEQPEDLKQSQFHQSSFLTAVSRLVIGLIYIGFFVVGSGIVPQSYMLSTSFLKESTFIYKMFYILLWGKVVLYKYVGSWLLAEGSCIMTGLTYNGLDENGNVLWNACANVKIRKYETAATFREIIASFNVNTNRWTQDYVFKRLKFLGSKALSTAISLFFLALWHGLFSGYFVCFALEFIIMKFESDVTYLKNKFPKVLQIWEQVPAFIRFIIGKWFTLQFLGYALVSFCLLSWNRWSQVYASVYYIGHIIFTVWIVGFPLVNMLLSRFSKEYIYTEKKE